MSAQKILLLLILSFTIGITSSCAEKAENLDGKIVFRTDRFDKQWAIVALLDGKLQKVISGGINPQWSPDGEKIAIANFDKDSAWISVVDITGKHEIRYPTEHGPFMLGWLPDGQTIIFSSTHDFLGKQESDNIFRYNLGAKTTTQLTFFDDAKTISGLAVSPDGEKMLFKRYSSQYVEDDIPEFYIANTDGSDLKTLKDIQPLDPSWSPIGSQIVYTSGSFGGEKLGYGVLSIYDFESRQERIILEARERGVTFSKPVFSPDGKQILFSRWSGLYVVNVDGTGLRTVLPPKRFSMDEYSNDLEPHWVA